MANTRQLTEAWKLANLPTRPLHDGEQRVTRCPLASYFEPARLVQGDFNKLCLNRLERGACDRKRVCSEPPPFILTYANPEALLRAKEQATAFYRFCELKVSELSGLQFKPSDL